MIEISFSAVSLLIALAFAGACAMVASSRGRSPVAWFVLGFFFPCIALVLVLVLPDLAAEEARLERLATQHRRLREQLLKDRQTADRRHAAAQQRIDAHDRALNVDTAGMLADADAEAEADVLPAPRPRTASAEERERFERSLWFYLEDQKPIGPMPFAELRRIWREGHIGASTYVWRDGMADWQRLHELPQLEGAFRA